MIIRIIMTNVQGNNNDDESSDEDGGLLCKNPSPLHTSYISLNELDVLLFDKNASLLS